MKTKFLQAVTVFVSLTLFFGLSGCKKNIHSQEPDTLYNFDATLFGGGEKGEFKSGLIKFRQDPDTARIATLDTYVINLEPNHSYLLQRAVNPVADTTGCSSTGWLTLGLGAQPQAIHTNSVGEGHAELWRDLTAVARGTTFHIHFQIVDSVTLAPVLTSDCHDFSVQ
ncbi:MAG TPA: hypothetical protein VK787_16690 [Puia sp.]|jgi:hypothetical protein|nr:hypothetical protein [Puia sp.]